MEEVDIFGIPLSTNNFQEIFGGQPPGEQNKNFSKNDSKFSGLKVCDICFNGVRKKSISNFLKCEDVYCLECLKEYFNFKLNNGDILQIRCPGSCGAIYSEFQLLNKILPRLLNAPDHKKFKQKLIEALTNKWDKIWCVNLNCGKIIINKEENKGICECGFEICFECREPWHPNQKCIDVMKANLKIETLIVRPCPKCKIRIEKTTGCNNMICSVCSSPWCWHCGEAGNGHSH